jgi:hypothetical protein
MALDSQLLSLDFQLSKNPRELNPRGQHYSKKGWPILEENLFRKKNSLDGKPDSFSGIYPVPQIGRGSSF